MHQWYDDYRPTFSTSFPRVAEINIRRHLVPFFGPTKLGDVTEQHTLRFITQETTEAKHPLRASTLLNILSVLRRTRSIAYATRSSMTLLLSSAPILLFGCQKTPSMKMSGPVLAIVRS
jgi:hypothetical protein